MSGKSTVFGCKVTCDLIGPKKYIMDDVVGGNISMKGDDHIGAILTLVAKGKITSTKDNKTDKRFTLIGLNTHYDQLIIYLVIIQGVKENSALEGGIGILIHPDNNPSDADFILKNDGPKKYFNGRIVYNFRYKEISTLIWWRWIGSIISSILF